MQKAALTLDSPRDSATTGAILLVSGDKLTVATVGGALCSTGLEVMEAVNCVTALDLCLTKCPALAVIDDKLPDSEGISLARQLTERFCVPFVFLSAQGDDASVSTAVAAGAMAYLVKPIASAQIIPVVRAALRRSQELRALQSQTERLTAAVQTGRQIGIATGLIMAKLTLDQQEAFERLRRQARARRARLEDFAAELLRVANETGGFYRSLESAEAPRRRNPEELGAAANERLSG